MGAIKPSRDGLIYCDRHTRLVMRQARLDNLRRRAISERQREEEVGPAACRNCGAQPCGHLWPVDRCCGKCTHEYPKGWRATHWIVCDGHRFEVMAVEPSPGVRLFVRGDGVIQWVELRDGKGRPHVSFLAAGNAHMPGLYSIDCDPADEDSVSEWSRFIPMELSGFCSDESPQLQEPELEEEF